MSQENVELLRQSVDAINRGDIDGALENAADDFEVDWSNAIGPGRKGIYNGKDQAREFWTSFVEAFDEFRWDFEEIIEADESRLIAVNHVRARGRGSGVRVDAVTALLWTAMKKGPPPVTRLPCSPPNEHRGGPARHVARWTRSQSQEARRLPALRAWRARRPARHPA